MSRRVNRRRFLQQTALAGAGFWVAGGVSLGREGKAANDKLNFACIGVGGKGSSDVDGVAKLGEVVALCDIDENYLNDKAKGNDKVKGFPDAQKFFDYREMLTKLGDKIDAVTVSTPDHTHAPASLMAMKLKKHVYCQKPLTHTVAEAREMRETAASMKVCTQMGNQGTTEDGLREAVEVIRSGAIGGVKEVHVWTNRPIWPQGADAILKVGPANAAALAALHGLPAPAYTKPTPPKHVHWDLFLGTAPERPYDSIYHPFSWRGWWDYGTGALGDMACHTANMAFMALKLGYPTSVYAESGALNPETYPTWARITLEFPAREGLQPCKFFWYEGQREGKKELPPPEVLQGQKPSDSGSLLVGEKGTLFSPNDYGASYVLLPEKDFKDFKKPEPSLPRNGKGDDGMKAEWVEAIRNGKPSIALSNFDYAALLTETILLGNAAMHVGKKKLDWDGPTMKFTNDADANKWLKTAYRTGW
jgi:predicted dehydrogenase